MTANYFRDYLISSDDQGKIAGLCLEMDRSLDEFYSEKEELREHLDKFRKKVLNSKGKLNFEDIRFNCLLDRFHEVEQEIKLLESLRVQYSSNPKRLGEFSSAGKINTPGKD